MGMSYLTSLNTQLFKNIAYVGSFGHILFNLIFNVNSNLAESSANCSGLYMMGEINGKRLVKLFRCSLPTAMSISRSEILRRKKAETEDEKLPSVKVLESVS